MQVPRTPRRVLHEGGRVPLQGGHAERADISPKHVGVGPSSHLHDCDLWHASLEQIAGPRVAQPMWLVRRPAAPCDPAAHSLQHRGPAIRREPEAVLGEEQWLAITIAPREAPAEQVSADRAFGPPIERHLACSRCRLAIRAADRDMTNGRPGGELHLRAAQRPRFARANLPVPRSSQNTADQSARLRSGLCRMPSQSASTSAGR